MDKIIIVEDEGITAMHLREMLGGWGYQVTATEDNAEDALASIATSTPDLALMDIRLKGRLDGLAAAELIQRRHDIPVVILSAHSDEGTLQRVKRSRAYGFVVKPFDEPEVRFAVESALYRYRFDKALRSSREWQDGALSSVDHPVIATDSENRIVCVNKAAEALTGWAEFDAFGLKTETVLHFVDEEGITLAEHPVSRVLQKAEITAAEPDCLLVSRNESTVAVGCRILQIQGDHDDLIGSVISLRRKRTTEDQGHRSNDQQERDPVTGPANRSIVLDWLGEAIAHARHENHLVAVIILDLDRFKEINENFGNAVGDSLLGAVGARVRNCVRRSDSVARIGGDEIAVIQVNLERAEGAVHLAEKLVEIFGDPFVIEGRELKVTASVGVAMHPIDGDLPEELVTRAEEAVNRAKAAGRNQYSFHGDKVQDLVNSERSLEVDLRKAIELGQLEVWYEPVFHLGSSEITGAEALLHWRHPDRGTIPASRIIQVADRCGLLASITDWILREALESSSRWQSVVPGFRVSINIAGSELRRRDLVPTMIRMLDDASLDARHLEIEIREEFLIRPMSMTTSLTLQRLRQLGVHLTLDNFGRAYASMRSLAKLPLSRLKIDRSLVAALADDHTVQTMVMAAIDLACSCGYDVVAKGIENEEQLQWLLSHGCELGQGDFLGAPRQADDLLDL